MNLQCGIDITLREYLASVQFDLVSGEHRQMFRVTKDWEYSREKIPKTKMLKMAMDEVLLRLERQIEHGFINPIERNGLVPGKVKQYKLKPSWTIERTQTRTAR